MIEEGIISQMVTLPTNMFSSVTLPATLWFFDKTKKDKDRILFIDARSIFTQVDRAHRKFSDEQIRNLGIITRLHEGDTEAFRRLIEDYEAEMSSAPEESNDKEVKTKEYWKSQIDWLVDRFPDGTYCDVVGLCKSATLEGEDGIKDQDYSLNAGRYVGVVIEDDGLTAEEYVEELKTINNDISALSAESYRIEKEIYQNIEELLGE